MVMMMFAPNSPVCQKEGAQGEEEEEAGGRRKVDWTGLRPPSADAPTGPTQVRGVGCEEQEKTWAVGGVLIMVVKRSWVLLIWLNSYQDHFLRVVYFV